ncbi:YokU family protein [Mesobacillus persicus]|nr:YokU family protein [Mesobacillus persicus]
MSKRVELDVHCEWCSSSAKQGESTVYWELPDGTRAIEITDVPSVICSTCGMVYAGDDVTKEIEDQLLLVDTNKINKTIKYVDLLELPRLLKRNYFDFSTYNN